MVEALEERLDHECDDDCLVECRCARGYYRKCRYSSCYECFLDRRADYVACIYCGRWHNPEFDTCFKCRPETRGRDDAAKALRQLILWRDQYECQYCGAVEGELQVDPRLVRPACLLRCNWKHTHLIRDDDGMRATRLHVDHVVPCAAGGRADEWNLQVLCNVCNIAKGATWHPGCRHDDARSDLCRRYYLIAGTYFKEEERKRFRDECSMFRLTGTWDPRTHDAWLRANRLDERRWG